MEMKKGGLLSGVRGWPVPQATPGDWTRSAPCFSIIGVLRRTLDWAYRRLGARYPRVALTLQFLLAHVVVAAGCGLLALYVDMSTAQFVRIFVVAQVASAVENVAALCVAFGLLRPAERWLRGDRTTATTVMAWSALAGLPLRFLRWGRAVPFLLNVVPISIFLMIELDVPVWPGLPILCAGVSTVLVYAIFLRFFGTEEVLRPLLVDVSVQLPDGADLGRVSVPLNYKLAVAMPAITIVSGVVAIGLASSGTGGLRQLGLGVLITIGVALTISLELTVLLLRSVLGPVRDLQAGTARVARGDFTVRLPVLGTDETGKLTGAFNDMVAGLAEREKLREAFGAFVDPGLAEMVIEEGRTAFPGKDVEATVLFLDIRDFTSFAEQRGAREAVARINEFYELIVPVLVRHGGHANKFIGDGVLGVFNTPERLAGHADAAVAAALEICETIREHHRDTLRIGIGINTGMVVAGTVGGGGRVEFTVIGDVVNTAARVERATRLTGDDLLITDATLERLFDDHGGFEERGRSELPGKSEKVGLHASLRLRAMMAA
jgi:adenylate cyclase